MARDDDVDVNEAAAEHIRELDAHLEKLKRQNEALDALAAEQGAEMEQLKRRLAEAADRFAGPERRDEAPPE
jgi:predicted RNase H-like nuclease (RuvC/YqgF family)